MKGGWVLEEYFYALTVDGQGGSVQLSRCKCKLLLLLLIVIMNCYFFL